MEQETLFHVGAVIIEAAVLLRLSLWLSSFGLHGLRSSVEKLRAWWGRRANVTEARQMEQQTALELDVLRCRVTCQMWNVLLALALLRFVSGQVLAALRLPRLFPEFDVSFFFLAVVGLTLNCKPSLITPKSLDAWHVVTHVIWNASILVAREIDVRDVILFTFATRFMFLVLAKRTWCFLLCALVTCSNMGFMALRQGEARLADGQDSLFVILYALLPGLVAIVFARKLLEENATLKLDLKSRQVELGAVSSLLTVCYDAVVEVDDSLSLTDDSRQLSTMLLHSAPSGKGLAGRSLLDFFAKEDHTRISEQFQSSIASESTSVMALNADMLDSDQNHVKVELFHAQFQNLANKRSFLLGVREIQGGETVDPMTKASPSVDSCPAIGTPGALSVVFDVPSFEILVLSEDLEMLCQSCLGKTPENVVEISSVSKRKEFAGVLQTMTNHSFHSADADAGHAKEQTFTFNLLGAGEVTASFLAEYDMLLDTMVGTVKILSEVSAQPLKNVPNKSMMSRTSSRGSRASSGSAERPRKARCEQRTVSGLISKLHETKLEL